MSEVSSPVGIDDVVHLVRPAAGEPAGALILHHGRGTSEQDLFPMLDELDPERRLIGLTPRGPISIVPPGGAHWFVVPRVGFPDPETYLASARLLAGWHDAVSERLGIPFDRIVLGGFSQGTVMSYALGLGPDRPRPAGILAMSGYVPAVDGWPLDFTRASGLPVMIAHGTLDPIMPMDFAHSARDQLEAAGAEVEYHARPVPHTVDPALLPAFQKWLARTIP